MNKELITLTKNISMLSPALSACMSCYTKKERWNITFTIDYTHKDLTRVTNILGRKIKQHFVYPGSTKSLLSSYNEFGRPYEV